MAHENGRAPRRTVDAEAGRPTGGATQAGRTTEPVPDDNADRRDPVLTNFAGVPVRVWKGFLPNMPESQPCEVFVFRIVVHSAEARAKLQELIPIAVPVPLHQVFDELEAQGKECEPYGAI